MKVEYDSEHDLLYIYFSKSTKKPLKTITIMPGIFADFDKDNKILGLEILDASELIDNKIEFDISKIEQVGN